MKEADKTQFSFTLERNEKEALESAAKEMGLSLTELLKTGAAFYTSFDPIFRKRVKNLSRNLGIQEYLILQNLAIKWMGYKDAESAFPGHGPSMLKEFMFKESGPITGEELYGIFKSERTQELEEQKSEFLWKKSKDIRLTDEEQAWLNSHAVPSAGVSKEDPFTGEEADATWTPEVKLP